MQGVWGFPWDGGGGGGGGEDDDIARGEYGGALWATWPLETDTDTGTTHE